MGDMSWLSYLVTSGSRRELEDFLKDKGFRKPKFAAEQFLKAQDEIEQGTKRKNKDVPVITGDKDTDALLEDEREAQENEWEMGTDEEALREMDEEEAES